MSIFAPCLMRIFGFLNQVRTLIDDEVVDVSLGERNTRPPGQASLSTEAFAAIEAGVNKHYGVITLPTMSTGATDMAYLRNRGIQCYGLVPRLTVRMPLWVLGLTAIRSGF